MFYLATCCTLCIWALELAMNLKHGEGWVFVLHLLVIGPLWLFVLAWFSQAVARKMRGYRGTGDPREA